MDALEKLRMIGIQKIREKTNLDSEKIEDILEKRFQNIIPVRAKGFIQVLEKSFDLDLSAWLEEYYQFQASNQKKVSEKKENPQEKNNLFFWIAILALLIVGGGILYWIYAKPQHSKNNQEEIQQSSITQETAPKPLLEPQEEKLNQEENMQENKIEENTQVQNPISNKEMIVVEDKPIDEYGTSVFPEIAYNEENILYITANAPLWIGIINIDTKKRIAKTKKEFDIPLDKQLLINIARGGFSASLDDEEKEFNTYKPIYFIHTFKGGLKQITKEEFMHLNGGVEW